MESASVKYSGHSTSPDDYQCRDGAMAFSTNAVSEDDAIRTVPPAAGRGLVVGKGDSVHVHSTAEYTHYIVAHEDGEGDGASVTVYWVDKESCGDGNVHCVAGARVDNGAEEQDGGETVENGPVFTIGTYGGAFTDMAFVGNTVILSTGEGRHYYLWSGEDRAYKYLGDRVPRMELRWGLDLELGRNVYFNTGIELEKDSNYSPSATDYTPYARIYYNHDHPASDQYYPDDNSGLNHPLAKGTTYRCYQESYRSKKSHPTLQGSISNGGSGYMWANLVQIPKTSNEYTYYTADRDSRAIRLVVDKRKSAGTAYVEAGNNTGEDTVTIAVRHVKNTAANYTAVMGCVNKFVNSMGKRSDRFVHPFFLRYAVRLYDGTHCNLSAPVLLYPNTGYAPFLKIKSTNTEVEAYAFLGTPCYGLGSWIRDEWRDIIHGVDVFVSQPFYPYDQGQGFDEAVDPYDYLYTYVNSAGEAVSDALHADFGIGRYYGGVTSEPKDNSSDSSTDSSVGTSSGSDADGFYAHDILAPLQDYCYYGQSNEADGEKSAVVTTRIAARTQAEIEDDIVSCCNYYKIGELAFDDIGGENGYEAYTAGGMTPFTIEHGTLNSLETRETLKEEEVSAGGFRGASLHVYNSRLHMYGGERELPEMYGARLQNGWANTGGFSLIGSAVKSLVRIRTDEGIKTVRCTEVVRCLQPWFFYPDSRAFEYWEMAYKERKETDDDGNTKTYEWVSYDLTPHDFLNGAYMLRSVDRYCRAQYDGYDGARYDAAGTEVVPDEDKHVSNLNKIYVSEAGNPFLFTNAMVCTAGSGRVIRLASASRALSQGQFGQFPLYAFTDEGIWAMSVGSAGAYETVQPMVRDVVSSAASVTSLDSEVAFASDRGIMLASGSTVLCLSETIDGTGGGLDPLELPLLAELMSRCLGMEEDAARGMVSGWAGGSFREFAPGCRMVYDYTHQRLTVYSPDADFAYHYSLRSKEWGMGLSLLERTVNSYPNALVLREDAETGASVGVECVELADLSEYDLSGGRLPSLFLTRPLKLDMPDTFKTVLDAANRGYFRQDAQENHVTGTVLYGSPDLFNWYVVATAGGREAHRIQNTHGSPYKYFRLLVISALSPGEGLAGCTVWYEPKDTRRLR